VLGGAEPEAWKYMSVTLPVACVFGALGALAGSRIHRLLYALLAYVLDTTVLVRFLSPGPNLIKFLIIKFTTMCTD
jgi:hypothetical protein